MTTEHLTYAAVMVTYRRPELLAQSIAAVLEQTEPPAVLIVVDNDADPAVRSSVSDTSALSTAAHYVAAPSNGGPAGGLQLGLEALEELDPDRRHAQVLFLDDDDPLPNPEVTARLLALRAELDARGARVGGVGLVGARWDARWARSSRPRDEELRGAVPVDYIGGNQAPLYDRVALGEVGGVDPDLFFGFDDLHLGLRLRRAGYGLFADGDAWRDLRTKGGRLGLDAMPRRDSPLASWRAYYGIRNLILILREEGSVRQPAITTVRGLGGAARRGTDARATIKGIVDGWLGRRGRRVLP